MRVNGACAIQFIMGWPPLSLGDASSLPNLRPRNVPVFMDGILEPAVIMGDQAAGLIKAVDVLKAIPNSMLQFCNWHAVEAIRAKFNKAGYTTEELNGRVNGEVEVPGLVDLSWAYIKSNIPELLKVNRVMLVAALRPEERSYITET